MQDILEKYKDANICRGGIDKYCFVCFLGTHKYNMPHHDNRHRIISAQRLTQVETQTPGTRTPNSPDRQRERATQKEREAPGQLN